MRSATNSAGLVLPDGIGVVVAAKILGYGKRYRVTGPNLMLEICDKGRKYGFRHYFFGGKTGTPERLAQRLSERFRGLIVAGTCAPPFTPLSEEEDAELVRAVNRTRPDVLWIGLGAPKQEKWMASHVGRITASAMVGVGAAFDFHSGNVKWAPRFIRMCGMEWAWRLAQNPLRMWRRNFDSPLFLGHVLLQAVREGWRGIRLPKSAKRATATNPIEKTQPSVVLDELPPPWRELVTGNIRNLPKEHDGKRPAAHAGPPYQKKAAR